MFIRQGAPEFQFHKGTIKTCRPMVEEGDTYKFQFHKGTIKTRWYSIVSMTHQFQFHKGTIKTDLFIYSPIIGHRFQFHKGTIKTDLRFRSYW